MICCARVASACVVPALVSQPLEDLRGKVGIGRRLFVAEASEGLERRQKRAVEGLALLASRQVTSDPPATVTGELALGVLRDGAGGLPVRPVDGEEEDAHDLLDASAAGPVAG